MPIGRPRGFWVAFGSSALVLHESLRPDRIIKVSCSAAMVRCRCLSSCKAPMALATRNDRPKSRQKRWKYGISGSTASSNPASLWSWQAVFAVRIGSRGMLAYMRGKRSVRRTAMGSREHLMQEEAPSRNARHCYSVDCPECGGSVSRSGGPP